MRYWTCRRMGRIPRTTRRSNSDWDSPALINIKIQSTGKYRLTTNLVHVHLSFQYDLKSTAWIVGGCDKLAAASSFSSTYLTSLKAAELLWSLACFYNTGSYCWMLWKLKCKVVLTAILKNHFLLGCFLAHHYRSQLAVIPNKDQLYKTKLCSNKMNNSTHLQYCSEISVCYTVIEYTGS